MDGCEDPDDATFDPDDLEDLRDPEPVVSPAGLALEQIWSGFSSAKLKATRDELVDKIATGALPDPDGWFTDLTGKLAVELDRRARVAADSKLCRRGALPENCARVLSSCVCRADWLSHGGWFSGGGVETP
jgi:hypothetical protein